MYKQYRLDVKRRLNKPFQVSLREADEMLFFNGNFYLRVNVEQPSMYIMVKKNKFNNALVYDKSCAQVQYSDLTDLKKKIVCV